MRAFVTGTDTGVGKTFVTALLTRALRADGCRTVALKPVCSGDRSDARILAEAADGELSVDAVNPLWFPLPLAPLVAARAENRTISIPALADWFRETSAGRESVLVEGAGGWLTPLAPGAPIADLCAALGLPVVVVAANRLGCVNHALLTVESIRARGLRCLGIVLNTLQPDDSSPSNRRLLGESTTCPVLAEILHGQPDLPPDVLQNLRGTAA
jgi:dethiobiotin synthetase